MPDNQPCSRSTVVYFGNEWAGANRTSSHHIAWELSKHFDVHYFECPGLRSPKATTRDLSRIFAKLRRATAPPRRAAEHLTIHTLMQVPAHRFKLIRHLNQRLMRHQVRKRLKRASERETIAWFTVPHVVGLTQYLENCKKVYYCIDDYSSLPGVNETAIRQMDELLTARADIVFVASETLLDEKRRLNDNTHLSPHGVDIDHFSKAIDEAPIPIEVAELEHPVIGFFGLIEQWIDLDLVEFIAKQRPNWSVVMIGRVVQSHDGVMNCPNVHFLGPRDYSLLPGYGRSFDVCILPYRLTTQVLHANPLKLREYLAMGKPVVSVRTPEISKFSDVVRIADTHEEFLAQLDQAVEQGSAPTEINNRIQRVAESSWHARVQWVLARVNEVRRVTK